MDQHGPVVLVHGGPEIIAVWSDLVQQLDRDDVVSVSPPGFGSPIRDGFEATMDGYFDWLVERLEEFKYPVDLVGHDYGAIHVFNVAMRRPDLIRSWVCDAIGVFHADYQWHDLAQLAQTPGAGEQFVDEKINAPFDEHVANWQQWGVREPFATRLAAGFDADMWQSVLNLYRSTAQPALADAGRDAAAAAARPGLALLINDDPLTGSTEMRTEVATAAGAAIASLDNAGHWWMINATAESARILNSFWAGLAEQKR